MRAAPIVTAIVTLAVLKLIVWWLEPRLAFYPIQGVQQTPAAAGLAFTDLKVPTADGEMLHGWWLDAPQPRGQVLFFHGNGGNLSLWLDVIVEARRRGFSVLAIDYRGYGASSGRPSEKGFYRDAEATVRYFDERLKGAEGPVIFWGRSIGSPVAAYAATISAPDALVLESPMPNVRTLLRTNPVMWLLSFLSSYRFPTSRFLRRYSGALLVIHGDRDSIVPFTAGRRVFDDAPTSRKTFVAISGADHNDLHVVNPPYYWRAIDEFVAELTRARSRP
jgi:fermentation-respiration switch protein FrsA (DUF1100 family)